MSFRPLNRGTSILAALVFVAILGVVALGVSALSPAIPGSQTAQAAATIKNNDAQKCSSVPDSVSLTLATESETDKQPCYCYNEADPVKKTPRTYQQFKYAVQAKLSQGNPEAQATRTKLPTKLNEAPSCIVNVCHADGNSCKDISSNSGTIIGNLKSAANTVVADYPTDMAKAIAAGDPMASPAALNQSISADTQASIKNAFETLKTNDNGILQNPADGSPYSSQYGDLSVAESELNNIQTCGKSACDVVPTNDQGDESPTTIDKSLTDSKVSLDPSQNQGDPTQCKSASCADGERDTYGPPDNTYKSSDPSQTVECYDDGRTCYPANEKDASLLQAKGFTCTGEQNGQDAVCTYKGNSTIGNGNGGNAGNGGNRGGGGSGGGAGNGSGSGSGSGGLGSGLEKMLGGFLQGLAKGLSQSAAQANAPACSSDPNAYAQQQQQYNMQLQQYNLQLQQYNLQSQYSQLNGLTPPPPPQAPVACQPNSSTNTCAAAPAQPTSVCQGTWTPIQTQQSNGVSCTTGWQCAPSTATPPTAQISCQPLVADVGMSIAISYTCGNATGSAGLGFDTGNAISGSTSTVIANPPQGANTATFGVQCRNQGLTANAQCSIQVGRASIVLVATPRTIAPQASSTIGWVTSGMQSCIVSSPTLVDFTAQNATNTSVAGAAITPPLATSTDFVLNCSTVGGSTKSATTTVIVSATST